MRRASADEAAVILELRSAAQRWLTERGIEQWLPGEISVADVQQQAAAGQWHVTGDDHAIHAALRLLWSDWMWADHEAQRPAVYVHGLVIDRAQAGRGLGARLLDWAAAQGQSAGAEVLRLDCMEANPGLRQYYAGLGFRQVGRLDFDGPWHSAVLLERTIAH